MLTYLEFKSKICLWFSDVDKKILTCVTLLSIFGIVAMLSVSPAMATRIGVSKFHFATRQVIFVIVSLTFMVIFSMLKDETILWISIGMTIAMILLLILVLILDSTIKGSNRWISLGIFSIQPSELLKPFFVVSISFMLKNFGHNTKLKLIGAFSCFGIVITLLIMEPDIGMCITYTMCFMVQIFVSGVEMIIIALMAILGIGIIFLSYLFLPYVEHRILHFIKGGKESGYQVLKSLQSIVEGGNLGKGPGDGVVKFQLPDAHSDYIFAAIGEEFGYIVCVGILLIYSYIIFHSLIAAIYEQNDIKRNSVFGFMMIIAMQVIVNIGVSINMFPSKGMVLPLISYGGSSILSTCISFGILLAFTKKQYVFNSEYDKIRFASI